MNFSINSEVPSEENNNLIYLLKSNDLKIEIEIIAENFNKCKDLYSQFFKKELLFQSYKEALMCNLDCLENVPKYLIFNELFFQKFEINLSKDDFKKYLLFIVAENFQREVFNFKMLIEVLDIYSEEDKDLTTTDFFNILFLVDSISNKEKKEIITFYRNLNTEKLKKTKQLLSNNENFLLIFKILMRWKSDLNSSWFDKNFLDNLLIVEKHFNSNKKTLSYLEFEELNNKQRAYNLPMSSLLSKGNIKKKDSLNSSETKIVSIEKKIEKKQVKPVLLKISESNNVQKNETIELKKSDEIITTKQNQVMAEKKPEVKKESNQTDEKKDLKPTKNLYRGISVALLFLFIVI